MNNPSPPGGSSTLKTISLSLLLPIALFSIMMLGRTQQSAISVAPLDQTGVFSETYLVFPAKYIEVETIAIPDPRDLFRGVPASDKSLLWKVHLALQLVKHPELNQEQVRIILDVISLSSTEFFTTSKETATKKIEADEALELLKSRAVRAFPNSAASTLFSNMVAGKVEEDILKLYYDMSALPLKKRRASFRNLSPNDRSDLWKTHLVLFLVKRPQLSELQKDVILSALSLATSDYFGVRSSDPAWKVKVREPSRLLERQIVDAFSLEDATKIFATLGDDEFANGNAAVLLRSISYKPLSSSGPYMQWSNSSISEQDFMLEQSCGCSTESDYCPIWSSCVGGSCSASDNGCGTLWNHPCNGACR